MHPAADHDKQLAQRLLKGDQQAFEQFVSKYEARLHCFLKFYGAAACDVEDVVQETFLRVYLHIDQYDVERRFTTWLFTIARRLLPTARMTLPLESLVEAPAAINDPAADLQAGEERGEFWRRIRKHTSDDEFQLLWFFYAEQLSLIEIAEIVGDSHAACKTRLSRARKRLKSKLSADECGATRSPAVAIDHGRHFSTQNRHVG